MTLLEAGRSDLRVGVPTEGSRVNFFSRTQKSRLVQLWITFASTWHRFKKKKLLLCATSINSCKPPEVVKKCPFKNMVLLRFLQSDPSHGCSLKKRICRPHKWNLLKGDQPWIVLVNGVSYVAWKCLFKNTSSAKTFRCLLLQNTVNFFPPVILSLRHFNFFGFVQLRALSSLKLMLNMGNNMQCWRTIVR